MAKLVTLEKISLKNHPEIKEDAIQQYIFDNPGVLELGDVSPIRREKILPTGGRLDMILGDEETHYEVEIQLGATDPSHIIRTIEYWDSEKKRYPQYDHCAVIIAEEITSRFMNVISLFNGAIPLIAYQMTAEKVGDNINLNFVKVLDRVTLGTDEENESEPTNRAYWEGKSDQMGLVDLIFNDVSSYAPDYELKYNKHYIGMARKNRTAENFIYFKAKKQYVWLFIKETEDSEVTAMLENTGLEADYIGRSRVYRIKISKPKDFTDNKEVITDMIHKAMDRKNIDY